MATNPLIGQVVTRILLADDRRAIKFVLADGREIVAKCRGDCCSYTWIEDVINHDAATGSPVIEVVNLDLPKELCQPTKTGNDEEKMEYYGLAIDTDHGRCTIAYRNSSNGHYGGSLAWERGYHWGGVYGQNISSENWRPLTDQEAHA